MGKLPICRSFIFETCWLLIATERLDIPSRSSTMETLARLQLEAKIPTNSQSSSIIHHPSCTTMRHPIIIWQECRQIDTTPRIHSSCALFHQWKDIQHQQNEEYDCCLKPFSMSESRMRICVALIHMESCSTRLSQSLEPHSFSSRGCKMLKTSFSLEHVALPIYGHETRDTQTNFLPCFTINCFGYIPGFWTSQMFIAGLMDN